MPAPDYAVEIATLEAGMASGEASIRGADGREIKYRTPGEIVTALNYFRGQAAKASAPGGQVASTTTYARFERG